MAVETFGADRDDIKGGKFPKLKMKTGEVERVGIVYFDDDPKTMFLGSKVHAQKGFKTFLCKSSSSKKEICCTNSWSGNIPKYHIGCVAIMYHMGKGSDGSPKLKDYTLIPWIFWEPTYGKLSSADKEFPLKDYDIKLTCSNEDFQTIDINSCNNSIWRSNDGLKKKILEESKSIYAGISKSLGADMSISEIKEMLGIDIEGSDDAASEVDLGSIVDSLD